MSWNVTDYEGTTCYERDGMRVFRTQDIDAIDREEQREAAEIRNQCAMNFPETECLDADIEDMKPTTSMYVVALSIVVMLFLCLAWAK